MSEGKGTLLPIPFDRDIPSKAKSLRQLRET